MTTGRHQQLQHFFMIGKSVATPRYGRAAWGIRAACGIRGRTDRSVKDMTVGPLFSKMSSSECIPTNSSFPSLRAWSIAPAWPGAVVKHTKSYRGFQRRKRTVMAEVKASVHPNAVLAQGQTLLGTDRPLPGRRYLAVRVPDRGHDAGYLRCCVAI